MNMNFNNVIAKLNLFSPITEIEIYLDVDFPLIFTYKQNHKIYLGFTLYNDDFSNEMSIYISELESTQDILDMLHEKVSVYSLLTKRHNENSIVVELEKTNLSVKFVSIQDKAQNILGINHLNDKTFKEIIPNENFYLEYY